MDLLAAVSGNRVHYSMNTVGGVRRDVDAGLAGTILKGVDRLEEQTKYYIQICSEEATVIKRLSGVGVVTYEDALRLLVVGPTARASGVPRDIRKDDPYLAYDELDFKVITNDHCDVYGRTLVRLGELLESYSLIRQILAKMPEGPVTVKAPRKVPVGEALSRYEAPRGEDVHYVRANGSEKPERVKVRAPTLANLQAVSHMLRDNNLADLPIVIAAIDPCFSCTDRTVELNRTESGRRDVMDWGRLHAHGIEFHRGRGIDFTELNRKLTNRMKTV
jgi:membrane-bound hydrogenase subunit alpha